MKTKDITKYCRERYRIAKKSMHESELKRLNKIFSTLGKHDESTVLSPRYFFQEDKFSTLEKIQKSISEGDNQAIIELLIFTSDVLRTFEKIPKKNRLALANGLDESSNRLMEVKNFLPKKRGQKERTKEEEFPIAFYIQSYRKLTGVTLEVAREHVASVLGLKEDLVHKRWKKCHKEADSIINSLESAQNSVREVTGSKFAFLEYWLNGWIEDNKVRIK